MAEPTSTRPRLARSAPRALTVLTALTAGAGLFLAGCGASDSTEPDAAAVQIEAAATEVAESAESVTPTSAGKAEPLVVAVADEEPSADATTTTAAASTTASTASSTTASSTASSTTTASTASSSTTAEPTTTSSTPPTTASTTTTAPTTTSTTAATTTTDGQVSVLETRIEVLRLAGLSTFDGGKFSPDAHSTKNIVLWFWGAH